MSSRFFIKDAVTGDYIAKEKGLTKDIKEAHEVSEYAKDDGLIFLLSRVLKMQDPFVYEEKSDN